MQTVLPATPLVLIAGGMGPCRELREGDDRDRGFVREQGAVDHVDVDHDRRIQQATRLAGCH